MIYDATPEKTVTVVVTAGDSKGSVLLILGAAIAATAEAIKRDKRRMIGRQLD